jgi:hypothetical protein
MNLCNSRAAIGHGMSDATSSALLAVDERSSWTVADLRRCRFWRIATARLYATWRGIARETSSI